MRPRDAADGLFSTAQSITGYRRLTPAEEAVWLSDRPGDPRVVALICQLEGAADVHRMSAALADISDAQPLLRSRPQAPSALARHCYWHPSSLVDPELLVVEHAGETVVASMLERLRLAVGALPPALSVGLVRGTPDTPGDVVVLVVHHAVTDGIGALSLLRQLLTAADRIDPESLCHPSPPSPNHKQPTLQQPLDDLPRRTRRMPRPPQRIAASVNGNAGSGYGYEWTSIQLDEAARPATTNDVLMAASVLAVERWNALHNSSATKLHVRRGSISLNVPVNLRPASERHSGIGNATGLVTLSLQAGEFAPGQLLARVTKQSLRAKAAGPSTVALAEQAVSALGWVPARVRALLIGNVGRAVAGWMMPTITVSNLGPADDALRSSAGLQPAVRSLHFLTTAGLPQGVSVTAAKMHGELHLAVSYARELFDATAAKSFFTLIVDQVQQLTAQPDIEQ